MKKLIIILCFSFISPMINAKAATFIGNTPSWKRALIGKPISKIWLSSLRVTSGQFPLNNMIYAQIKKRNVLLMLTRQKHGDGYTNWQVVDAIDTQETFDEHFGYHLPSFQCKDRAKHRVFSIFKRDKVHENDPFTPDRSWYFDFDTQKYIRLPSESVLCRWFDPIPVRFSKWVKLRPKTALANYLPN